MRLKKFIAFLCATLVLCGGFGSDALAAKANRGQFGQETTAREDARQVAPDTSPSSRVPYYNNPTPTAHTAANANTGIKIGSTYYKSLQDAVNSVKDGQTIHVTKNVTLSKAVGCNRQIDFTIDFHRHELKMPGKDSALYLKKGAVSLKRMRITGWSKYSAIYVGPEASVVIEGGNYKGQIKVYGTLTVEGGVLQGEKNYATIYNTPGGEVNIQGGTIHNQGPYSAVIFNMGTMSISEGTIATVHEDGGGVYYAAIQNGGKLFISGGTINGNSVVIPINNSQFTDGDFTYTGQCFISGGVINGRVNTSSGARTSITNGIIKSYYYTISCTGGNVEVTGGSITSEKEECVYVKGGTADIRGGRFDGAQKDGGLVAVCEKGIINISGGIFIGSDPWVQKYEEGTINLSGSASSITVSVPKK